MTKQKVSDLITPSVLVDLERLKKNISDMATRAKDGNVNLRPHIKTHKCIEIGRMQLAAGANGITVSTLGEASAFAEEGFKDITYAVPLSPDKFEGVLKISELTHLNVLVDNPTIVSKLGKFCKDEQLTLDVLVKIDCGYPRCGVNPSTPAAVNLIRKIVEESKLDFKGILTHAGHSYDTTYVEEIKAIANQEQNIMIRFARTLKEEGAHLAPEVVSVGSTPTVRLADEFQEGVTEVRPGNYVFFDFTQVALGVCEVTDCALTVLSSVVSINENRVIIDAGATALSKDMGPTHIEPHVGYGKLIRDYDRGELNNSVMLVSLSQEHGKIIPIGKTILDYDHGNRIRILPNHSCLTANLYDNYYVVKGDSILDRWRIHRERFE